MKTVLIIFSSLVGGFVFGQTALSSKKTAEPIQVEPVSTEQVVIDTMTTIEMSNQRNATIVKKERQPLQTVPASKSPTNTIVPSTRKID
ncbi:MAG: hypothetical protein IT221_10865 [Fluviicola sp.]|nr:hypothetical protein [Fluviicola sp.]